MDIILYRYVDVNADTFDKKLEIVGVCDDYISCIFERKFFGCGNWEIVLPNSSMNIEAFQNANFFKIRNRVCGLINQQDTVVNEDEETTTFRGTELKGLAYSRVIDPRVSSTEMVGTIGWIKNNLITANLITCGKDRRIPSKLTNQSNMCDGWTANTRFQPTFSNLGETLEELSRKNDSGWYANIENVSDDGADNGINVNGSGTTQTYATIVWYMDIAGRCRTYNGYSDATHYNGQAIPVIISHEHQTLLTSEVEKITRQPNVAYAAGQGTFADRSVVVVDEHEAKRLDRIEMYVDARDLEGDENLAERGLDYLSEYSNSIAFSCEASPVILERYLNYDADYYTSFNLGDLVSIKDENVGNDYMTARLTGINEVYEDEGMRLELEFGDQTTLTSNLTVLLNRTNSLLQSYTPFASSDNGTTNYVKYMLGIRESNVPYLKFLPVYGDFKGDQRITGTWDGKLIMRVNNVENGSQDYREIILADSTGGTTAANCVQLKIQANGQPSIYNFLHTGNTDAQQLDFIGPRIKPTSDTATSVSITMYPNEREYNGETLNTVSTFGCNGIGSTYMSSYPDKNVNTTYRAFYLFSSNSRTIDDCLHLIDYQNGTSTRYKILTEANINTGILSNLTGAITTTNKITANAGFLAKNTCRIESSNPRIDFIDTGHDNAEMRVQIDGSGQQGIYSMGYVNSNMEYVSDAKWIIKRDNWNNTHLQVGNVYVNNGSFRVENGQIFIGNKTSQWPYLGFYTGLTSGGDNGKIYYDCATYNNTTNSKFMFREFSTNSANGDRLNYYEDYWLPNCNADRTSNNTYNILTTKSPVPASSGGLGYAATVGQVTLSGTYASSCHCYRIGRLVLVSYNLQLTSAYTANTALCAGFPIPYRTMWCATGEAIVSGAANLGRMLINNSGQLICDRAVASGKWISGCFVYEAGSN